jgi:hypothetical protein
MRKLWPALMLLPGCDYHLKSVHCLVMLHWFIQSHPSTSGKQLNEIGIFFSVIDYFIFCAGTRWTTT